MLNAIQGVSYGQNAYVSVYASRRVAAQTGAVRPAQPDMPVQAVEPVRSVPRTEEVTEHPDALRRWSSDPVSMAVRSRMEYMDDAALAKLRNEAGASFLPARRLCRRVRRARAARPKPLCRGVRRRRGA